MSDHFYLLALSLLPGIGSVHTKNLISHCGDAKSVFDQKKGRLIRIPGIGPKIISGINMDSVFKLAEEELEFAEKNNIEILAYTDAKFPKRLLHCADSPILLYSKGTTDLNASKSLAIVGTRKATKYGRDFVGQLLADLKDLNVLVVSGLALGIDAQAHKSALENNLATVGVLGHPLNTMYPSNHINLAKDIVGNEGMILSEYASSQAIIPANFPMRNRIVAGMTDATLIVESAKKGGAVITANIANSYNRDVFALPGRYKDKYSAGCNFLLKSHRAHLLESADDLLRQMGWADQDAKPRKVQRELALDLNEQERKVVELLKLEDSLESDLIVAKSKLSVGTVATTMLELELKGIVNSLPGNRYELN